MNHARMEDIVTQRHGLQKILPLAAALTLGVGLAGCGSAPASPEEAAPSAGQSQTSPPETSTPRPTEQPEDTEEGIVGTIVEFTTGDVRIEVSIDEDNAATRSFVEILPMTLEFSDFGGNEKVASPTAEFDYTDVPGSNPMVGDLFSYRPRGNIGFFYDDEGNTHSEQMATLGTTEDTDQIELLDGEEVTIAVAD